MKYIKLAVVLLFSSLGMIESLQGQDAEYDLRFVIDSLNCQDQEVCYTIQIRNATESAWNLAGQNYRIYYNASKARYIDSSVRSLLPRSYSAPQLSELFEDLNASGMGPLPFDTSLAFINYAIDLNNLSQGGIILSPGEDEWVDASSLCFRVAEDVLEDPNQCLELIWSIPQYTLYFEATVEVAEWVGQNTTIDAVPSNLEDLTTESNSGDACLASLCGTDDPENNMMACTDGIDNDNDGLIDCDDPNCDEVASCAPAFDINLALEAVDCETNEVCYNIQLRSANSGEVELADQRYRLYYNTAVGTFSSASSLLGNAFNDVMISGDSPVENIDSSQVGVLDYDGDYGFVDFSINLADLTTGSDLILTNEMYVNTASLCFTMTEEAISDDNVCFESNWAREMLTMSYGQRYLEVTEWIGDGETSALMPNQFNDLDADSGNNACFDSVCSTDPEMGGMQCQDGLDNDNDGLIDCDDPDCNGEEVCEEGGNEDCDAMAPTLRRN